MIVKKVCDSKFRKFLYIFMLLAVLSVFISGCKTAPVSTENCIYRQQGLKPPWVEADSGIPGYYTGVGFAEKKGDQLEEARKKALAALCDTVNVSVKSSVSIKVSEESEKGVSKTTSRSFEHSVETFSDLNLGDIYEDGRWLDQDNCFLWVRLKVNRNLVNQYMTLKKADSLYRKAVDRNLSLSPSERIKTLADASTVLESVDFSKLPAHYGTKELYTGRFKNAEKEISVGSSTGKILFTVSGDSLLGADVRKNIAELFMKGMKEKAVYKDTDRCIDEHSCVEFGRNDNAMFLVSIGADTDFEKGNMGMWKASLALSVTVFDLSKNSRITDRVSESGSIFSFDKNSVNWYKIIDSMFDQNKFEKVRSVLEKL